MIFSWRKRIFCSYGVFSEGVMLSASDIMRFLMLSFDGEELESIDYSKGYNIQGL